MSSKTDQDPDRGFGKFYVNRAMFAHFNPCLMWRERLPVDNLTLTKENVRRLLRDSHAPVWWILARLRTTHKERHSEAFFSDLWVALNHQLDENCRTYSRSSRAREFETVRVLLNYLYDHKHNSVIEPFETIYEQSTYLIGRGDTTPGWSDWTRITKKQYEELMLDPRCNIRIQRRNHYGPPR